MRDELYNIRKQSHRAAKKHGRVKKTPMGNEQWVRNCVDWLILRVSALHAIGQITATYFYQGALMNPGEKTAKELHHRFERSVRRTDLQGQITIVSSAEDEPPKYFDSTNGANILQSVKCGQLTNIRLGVKKHRVLCCDYSSLKVSSKPWYSLERDYQQVDFKIEAQFGAEDVKFECRMLSLLLLSCSMIDTCASITRWWREALQGSRHHPGESHASGGKLPAIIASRVNIRL